MPIARKSQSYQDQQQPVQPDPVSSFSNFPPHGCGVHSTCTFSIMQTTEEPRLLIAAQQKQTETETFAIDDRKFSVSAGLRETLAGDIVVERDEQPSPTADLL